MLTCCCSVAKLCLILLWPHVLQRARPPCPSPSPGVGSNSCPLSQWCYPTISSSVTPSPPALSFSQHQGLFQGFSHQVAKVLGLQLQHQCFQWILELISFRIDWFDLLTVRGTLKNLLHYYNLKASILWCSAFIMVHVLHPYMTTGKKQSFGCLDLCRWSIVSAF